MKLTGIQVVYTVCFALLGLGLLQGCKSDGDQLLGNGFAKITGETMGTTYTIVFHPDSVEGVKNKVENLLVEINHSLSTYEENSLISQVNRTMQWNSGDFVTNDSTARLQQHFNACFREAYRVYRASNGAFDPTVGPLVKYWGFGWTKEKPEHADKAAIDSLVRIVGLGQVPWIMQGDQLNLEKRSPDMLLDFSAIAKGYAVDQVARLLNMNGIIRYMIEIGGEVKVSGKNPKDEPWKLGIQNPVEQGKKNDLYTTIALSNRGMATSGNYRNYYVLDGEKIFHTINPRSGYPEKNSLRSATIVHPSCMTADALATAAMVKGTIGALTYINSEENAEGFFIYQDSTGALRDTMTPGFYEYLLN